ncbi:MAG TPA: site-2 protease family protein [Aggregatilineaceae bacterium]|nr:site-2 protease family protein [Aggregatilineaceae bacterium]
MLNEPSIVSSGQTVKASPATPVASRQDPTYDQLRAVVANVMDIYTVDHQPSPPATISYVGRLRVDSETAYAQLDEQFALFDYHVILTTNENNLHVVMGLKGRVRPKPRPVWPNALLLVLTVLSLLSVGAAQDAAMRDQTSMVLWHGWPYALSLLLILGAHELGHYFAARHHGVSVTLPYFIPLPIGFFGTLGAFIQLREPMRNRKILFDVGVAGPLAGLIVAIPILLVGLATSHLEPIPKGEYILEGNSLLYAATKFAIFGKFLPSATQDVFINQLAKAGWTGLLITGLNLIPLGQLDGGHVIFTLLGKRARRLYLPVLIAFLVLSFLNTMWVLWTLILFFLGRYYAVPLDTVTPLDSRRRWLGYTALAIFVLVFVPNPLQFVRSGS